MSKKYIPDRNDIVLLDFEPTKGREIEKYRPALILSSKDHNNKTGLLICCPISTSIRGGVTEVPVSNLDSPSVVVANLVHTLDWKERNVKKIAVAEKEVLTDTLLRLLPLIGASQLLTELET